MHFTRDLSVIGQLADKPTHPKWNCHRNLYKIVWAHGCVFLPVSGKLEEEIWHITWSINWLLILGIRNIRSQDYLFPGTFVPMMELSFSGPFVPWNIRSLDRSFRGTFVPWNFRSRYPGPFLPRTVRAFVSRAVPGLEQRNKQKRSPMTATVHSRYTVALKRAGTPGHCKRTNAGTPWQ